MVWVDTDTNLDQFNIGYAEVVVLIGMSIVQRLKENSWDLPAQLETDLLRSLAKVTYQDRDFEEGALGLPKVLADLGALLKGGFQREKKVTREVRPALSEIINRVNAIIGAAHSARRDLLVIVDGLDRKDFEVALEMFSSSLLTALNCHIVYAIPISLRYSSAFQQPIQGFSKCLDLDNVPVFQCSDQKCPTTHPDAHGRKILKNVMTKRLGTLSKDYADTYRDVFEADAIELLCEQSGGVMRDLVRLASTACLLALQDKTARVTIEIARQAVKEERKTYSIEDYQFSELDAVNRTGLTTSKIFDSIRGKVVICEELLHHKLILGYEDPEQGRWFDINPILMNDLKRWRSMREKGNGSDL